MSRNAAFLQGLSYRVGASPEDTETLWAEHPEEGLIGNITWATRSGEVKDVSVDGRFQRRGLATELFPKQDIRHSDALTEDGAAWAKARP